MSPRGRQYTWAFVVAVGLFGWQVWQLALRFDVVGRAPKSNVMQQQLVEQLLSMPSAMLTIAAYLCLGLVAHVALTTAGVGIYRQATTVLRRDEGESVSLCMVFLAALIVLAMMMNKRLYPLSSAFADIELLMVQPLSPVLMWGLGVMVATAMCLTGARFVLRHPKVSLGLAGIVGAGLVTGGTVFDGGKVVVRKDPDIILLGIDSLRPDFMPAYGSFPGGLTPVMDKALASSVIVGDARTPLARTFASYMSLLTGKNPIGHGARFNLYPRSEFDSRSTLAWVLKEKGYTTMLAMDESRFANFDSTFGFDTTIAPKVGALDFVIGGSFDLLGTNLLFTVLPASEMLSHVQGNRAAYRSYLDSDHPEKVVRALRGVDESKPLFLVSHLCLPHWPYVSGGVHDDREFGSVLGTSQFADSPTQYLRALAHVDQQFAEIFEELRREGRLSNAVVVVMSDHGEDFALQRDRLKDVDPDGGGRELRFYGHGSFALSDAQNHVVMGIQRFKDGQPVWKPRTMAGAASIIDVAPTLADLASDGWKSDYEGISWKPALDSGANLPSDRLRFFENGLRSTGVEQAKIDEREVAGEMAYLYDIRPDLRFEIKPSLLPSKLAEKQRGVLRGSIGVMTDPVVGTLHMAGDCWRVIDYANKTMQCVPYPAPTAAVAELQKEVCRYYRADGGFSKRWCKTATADIPLTQTARGSL